MHRSVLSLRRRPEWVYKISVVRLFEKNFRKKFDIYRRRFRVAVYRPWPGLCRADKICYTNFVIFDYCWVDAGFMI